MHVEFYKVTYTAGRLDFTPSSADVAPANTLTEADYAPSAPYRPVWRLGDAEHLWCEAYRTPGGTGGLLVLRDFDEALVVMLAPTQLAFVEAVGHTAHMVTYGRYAADIFEHMDEDDDV